MFLRNEMSVGAIFRIEFLPFLQLLFVGQIFLRGVVRVGMSRGREFRRRHVLRSFPQGEFVFLVAFPQKEGFVSRRVLVFGFRNEIVHIAHPPLQVIHVDGTAFQPVQQSTDLELLPLGRLEATLLLVSIGIETRHLRIHSREVRDVIGIGVVFGMGEGPRLETADQFHLTGGQRDVAGVEGVVDGEFAVAGGVGFEVVRRVDDSIEDVLGGRGGLGFDDALAVGVVADVIVVVVPVEGHAADAVAGAVGVFVVGGEVVGVHPLGGGVGVGGGHGVGGGRRRGGSFLVAVGGFHGGGIRTARSLLPGQFLRPRSDDVQFFQNLHVGLVIVVVVLHLPLQTILVVVRRALIFEFVFVGHFGIEIGRFLVGMVGIVAFIVLGGRVIFFFAFALAFAFAGFVDVVVVFAVDGFHFGSRVVAFRFRGELHCFFGGGRRRFRFGFTCHGR
mmetsp:Transcript_19634/g.41278  ORF Transcript_19634/g.41278 Transcript_19634/m.41278 type:complete len:445 (+) Transcript_19634:1723-3057(+)